jgi:sarcosine oxidase subunit alpha
MPHDLGRSGPRERREDEYLGKRSLFTPEARRSDRRQLVGLKVPDGGTPLVTGSHLIPTEGARRSLGFVTSSCVSPTLGRSIALALMEGGLARIGQTVRLFDNGAVREAGVTEPCASDPKGDRLFG